MAKEIMTTEIMTTNRAVAEAVKLAKPQVVPVYPITPQTTISEYLAQFVADGDLDAEYIRVESEHSAISATLGASEAGVRVFTATSSQGLMLMHEILFAAAGMRAPIVMADANRAISAPLKQGNFCSIKHLERSTRFHRTKRCRMDSTLCGKCSRRIRHYSSSI